MATRTLGRSVLVSSLNGQTSVQLGGTIVQPVTDILANPRPSVVQSIKDLALIKDLTPVQKEKLLSGTSLLPLDEKAAQLASGETPAKDTKSLWLIFGAIAIALFIIFKK